MRPRVYLAGGFNGWAEQATRMLPSWECIDPGANRNDFTKSREIFTPLDIGLIENSRAMLAYYQASNPTLVNVSFEIGYARRAGRLIVLVVDPAVFEKYPERYLGMPMSAADAIFYDLNKACHYLDGLSYYEAPTGSFQTKEGQDPILLEHKPWPEFECKAFEPEGKLQQSTMDLSGYDGWITEFFNEDDFAAEGTTLMPTDPVRDANGRLIEVWGAEVAEGGFRSAMLIALHIAVQEGAEIDEETARQFICHSEWADRNVGGPSAHVKLRRVGS